MLFGYFEETVPLSVRLFLRKSGVLLSATFSVKIACGDIDVWR